MDPLAVADLARSGISVEAAEFAGIFDVPDASQIYPDFRRALAEIMPYFTPEGAPMTFLRNGVLEPFCRARFLDKPPAATGFVKSKPPPKYGQPAKSGVRAYFPRAEGVDWPSLLADPKAQPRFIVEGEKKALSATLAGFPTIGLGGVHNFTDSKTGGLIAELDALTWRGGDVYIIFDSDAATNPHIQAAESRLVDELTKRGARCFLVRLPFLPDGSKCGVDDYLLLNGPDRFERLLTETDPLGALDAAVVALNRHVSWIEAEGQVYDHDIQTFLPSGGFMRGSKHSTLFIKEFIAGPKGVKTKRTQVSLAWLTHPLASRYSDMLFRPGMGTIVPTPSGARALNTWRGWTAEPGDVTPFLDLHYYLMGNIPEEHRDFLLKWLAFKAQHPMEKIAIAAVLVGMQGCGKTLWSECVQRAFDPYSVSLKSAELKSNFTGWMEKSLIAVFNEVEAVDMEYAKDRLKNLISEKHQLMNEKYRVARDIQSYTSFILTANSRAIGAFSGDDRRMFVVGCPVKRENAFYQPAVTFRNAHAPALMHWLLNYDLKGWRPPEEPPKTAEKVMACQEGLTEVGRIAMDMLTAKQHTILMWMDEAFLWANAAKGGSNAKLARHADEVMDSYNVMPLRDWYTPDELAQMFPQILGALHGMSRTNQTPAGEISRQLRDNGVPYLQCADDVRGFLYKGRIQQFLVIANRDDWEAPLRQADFERIIKAAPTVGQAREALRKGARRR